MLQTVEDRYAYAISCGRAARAKAQTQLLPRGEGIVLVERGPVGEGTVVFCKGSGVQEHTVDDRCSSGRAA